MALAKKDWISSSMILYLLEYEYTFIQLTTTRNYWEIIKSCKKMYTSSDTQKNRYQD